MYIPKHFKVTDKDEIYGFIEANAFGQLISSVEGRPYSTHIPFLINENKTKIIGHLAKQNPQLNEIEGQEVLVTLQGLHDYISPSWYSTAGVPTWNYQAVHIYGLCHVFSEPEKLKSVVNSLTHKFESGLEEPWEPEYADAMLNGITGVEIVIGEVQGKYKLSQNRPMQDRKQVVKHLDELGSGSLADQMRWHSL